MRHKATRLADPAVQRYRTLAKMKYLSRAILHQCSVTKDTMTGMQTDQFHKSSIRRDFDNLDSFFEDLDECVNGFRGVMLKWEDILKDQKSRISNKSDLWTTDAAWKSIWDSHVKRGTGRCPICLGLWTRRRTRVLLTCSHVFHQTCIETMENVGSQNGFLLDSGLVINMCPVCRQTNYEKCAIPSTDV
ncbi:hypothetical protein D915_008091 [Fasciola hepatica]|uniref:RING-type domain-containing protein n=1 Tax=Fasciola hepatica TaxID=6192 RepID=A0A4E0RY24_FASHE|nr:hypothetical protein D915_008091 [Fasciola hepatica]